MWLLITFQMVGSAIAKAGIYVKRSSFTQHSTVVPATADPLGERPPALAGHFCDVPTTLPC